MNGKRVWLGVCVLWMAGPITAARAQESQTLYGALRADAKRVSATSLAWPVSQPQWRESEEKRRQQWLEMLGLSPLPERTPLEATVTGTLERDNYVVEKIHFQSVPGAYVAGNLYRPANVEEKLPAVLYLCGHTKGKVNDPYQANPRWFGEHGYVALVLDPIQLGESQGFHHGTYREEHWDWPSRGYTPAGTEVWNAMRALDYLETRSDVDADRMGVTGLSGGGVISWCLGAADKRVKAVAPVCQSGSIEQVITDRSTDGHCDCAFWINYYRWCWPDIGALIAPRALLIAAGADDVLWRPSGYRDVAGRIRKQYADLEVADKFDLVEDLTPHGYTPKLRKAIFTFFNTHLKGDPTPVTDDVTDYVEPEENLLVFDGELPDEDRMRDIDRLLVQSGELPTVENAQQWLEHQRQALQQLRQTTFRHTSTGSAAEAGEYRDDGSSRGTSFGSYAFETADGLSLNVKIARPQGAGADSPWLALAVPPDTRSTFAGGGSSRPSTRGEVSTVAVEVRNTAATSLGPGYLWTARRSYPLVGQTLPERQVSDLLEAIAMLNGEFSSRSPAVYGKGYTASLAIYAGILDPTISEIVIENPPSSHEDADDLELLGVLRVGDLPHNLALAYPRPITYVGEIPEAYDWTRELYEKLGKADRIRVIDNMRQWQPAVEPNH